METSTSLIQLREARFEHGFWKGMGQPSVLVSLSLKVSSVDDQTFLRFDEIVTAVGTEQGIEGSSEIMTVEHMVQHPILSRVLKLSLNLLKKMGMPVMGGVAAFKNDAINPKEWVVALNLPLLNVPLSHSIMRPSFAVPRASFSQTASD